MKTISNYVMLFMGLLIVIFGYECTSSSHSGFSPCIRKQEAFLEESDHEDELLLHKNGFNLDANPMDNGTRVYRSIQDLDSNIVNNHKVELARTVYLVYKDKELSQIDYSYSLPIEDDDLAEYTKLLDREEGLACISFNDLLTTPVIEINKPGFSISVKLVKSLFWIVNYSVVIDKNTN